MEKSDYNSINAAHNREADSSNQVENRSNYDYEDSFFSYLKDVRNCTINNDEDSELIIRITEKAFCLQQALLNFAPAVNEELQYINEIIAAESDVDDYFFNSSILSLNTANPITDFFPQWRKDMNKALLAAVKSYNSTVKKPIRAREKLVHIACKLKMPVIVLENFYRLILNYLFMWHDTPINYEINIEKNFSLKKYSPEQIKFLADKFLIRPIELEEKVLEIYRLREELINYKHSFLQSHLRLVITLAKKFRNYGLSFSDIVQEGNLGLMRAIDKFDLLLGHKFSTYAVWWIKHSIIRGIATQARTIRIPTHMLNLISKINRAEQKLLQDNGKEPESAEIAKLLDLSVAKVNAIRRMARQAISLQAPLQPNNDGMGSFEEILEDESTASPSDISDSERNYDKLYELLKLLSEREQQIIILRFGLFGNKATPLREISEKFGLTRERIRQLEMKIIAKMRSPKALKYLSEYHHSQ
ncbi:MAG: sigma-70 family RNA polymerase sigma factor [Lentisphaeria bacterium]|nr:sigma-70 family RNA polymerase sigma factor [Lentisphaeria bacterium]